MTRYGIGQAVNRIEDKKLVQGKGKFISDLNFDDQAYMVIIRSPYARAKILNIDFIENTLFIVNERSDGVYLETIDVSPALTDTGESYLTHLDRKIKILY